MPRACARSRRCGCASAAATIDDLLELDGSTGTYRKTVLLPSTAAGRVTVREVEVEDYAGNTARFAPDNDVQDADGD